MISRIALRLRHRLPSLHSIGKASFHDGATGGDSDVYRTSLRFARPATVTWSERFNNSVSFIGTVEYPLKHMATKNGRFGVHTILRVQSSPRSHHTFRIHVSMWDMLAERAVAHLKQNDYIYVAGELGTYMKSTTGGAERMFYKVTANELNYVQAPEGAIQVVAKAGTGESSEEKYRNRLLLWQLFFANPDEWYDARMTKKTSRHPDFKHKSTGEALWLSRDDPPWVKRQLSLLETRLAGKQTADLPCSSLPSNWISDELLTVPKFSESYISDHSDNDGNDVETLSDFCR